MTSSVYLTGTVSVSGGNAVVTGTGTAWSVALVTGGMFSFAGMSVPIASVESDTSLTLAYPWPGATASGAYAIARETSEAVRAAWINDRLAQILTKLSLAGIHPDGAGTLVERDALSPVPAAGFLWLRVETGFDLAFYKRTASGWDGPFSLKGDDGSDGPAGALNWIEAGWATATGYAFNNGLTHNGTSYRCYVAHTSGAATEPGIGLDWQTVWKVTSAKGGVGPAGTIEIGTVETVLPGAPATVTNVGTTTAAVLDIEIPQGADGDPGAAATISVGTVTTLPAGSAATVTNSGTSAAATFDFALPAGTDGAGAGDMLKATYDPTNKNGDAFDMAKMAEAADAKVMTAGERTKLGHIAITQAVDLDVIKARVNALDAAVVLMGAWDASSGAFPGGGAAQAGASYIVSVGGTVGGVQFTANDRLLAIADNASTSTFADNWLKLDYTDQVLSVAGKAGAVTLIKGDVGLGNVDNTSDANKPVSSAQQTALDGKVAKGGDSLSGGFTTTAGNDGTKSSGTYTPTPTGGNLKRIVNGGAFSLAAPSVSGDYTIIVQITNSASAGVVTLSGFSKTSGDSFTTTNGDDFFVFITKINGFTHAAIQALQ